MSYLEVPRIHFGGLFYTDPSTINNTTANYTPSVDLKDDATRRYKRSVVGWSPTGVAQFWLEDCRVLAAVGRDGTPIASSDKDALVGSAVESPSPTTPQEDGKGGFYGIAKLVDLDPDQQGRSEVWGLRVFVKIPGGGGFSGLWETPDLRDIYLRGNGGFSGNIQQVGGILHSRLVEIAWHEPGSPSPAFDALYEVSPDALDMKLTVDLYQRTRGHDLQTDDAGNRFGYGRLMGTLGKVSPLDPVQIVPGRRLAAPPKETGQGQGSATGGGDGGDDMDAKETMGRNFMARMSPASSVTPWSNTDGLVREIDDGRTFLTLDFGGSPPLAAAGRGKLDTDGTSVKVGLKGSPPFTHGTIEIGGYLQIDAALERKDTFWLPSAGVYQIELVGDEVDDVKKNLLEVRTTAPVLQEQKDGLYLAIDPPVLRSEPDQTCPDPAAPNPLCPGPCLTVYRYGEGQEKLPEGVALGQPQVLQWPSHGPYDPPPPPAEDTGDVRMTLAPEAEKKGFFPITVETLGPVSLVPIRQPLDSQMYVVDTTPSSADHTEPLSVLFWMNHAVVDDPNWDDDVGLILGGYARLYPGMKGRLDIGDEATVRGFVQSMLGFMSRPFGDPDYMPVVRDLSPATVKMVLAWLEKVLEEMRAAD